MAQNKRFVIEQRRSEVVRLYLMGMPQYKIAAEVGVSVAQITNDVQQIRKKWAAENLERMTEHKAQELAKLDLLEQTAWEAWEKSKGPLKRTKSETYANKKTWTKTDEVESAGDPRFLSQIENCIKGRCQLLGITDPAITINNVNIQPKEWAK